MKTIYRLLEKGERIEKGDELYSNSVWCKAESFTMRICESYNLAVRRRMNVAEIYDNTVYYDVTPKVAALEKEVDELKAKQVKWEGTTEWRNGTIELDDKCFTVYFCGKKCTIPLPPKKDEADQEEKDTLVRLIKKYADHITIKS